MKHCSPSYRKLMERSTRGSPPATDDEITRGYRTGSADREEEAASQRDGMHDDGGRFHPTTRFKPEYDKRETERKESVKRLLKKD